MGAGENLPSQVVEWLALQASRLGRELAVTLVNEQLDCTVYCWTTAEAAHGRMDSNDLLAGNVPLILDRDGQLWLTGTAHPVDSYVADFRGPRRLMRLVEEPRRR